MVLAVVRLFRRGYLLVRTSEALWREARGQPGSAFRIKKRLLYSTKLQALRGPTFARVLCGDARLVAARNSVR